MISGFTLSGHSIRPGSHPIKETLDYVALSDLDIAIIWLSSLLEVLSSFGSFRIQIRFFNQAFFLLMQFETNLVPFNIMTNLLWFKFGWNRRLKRWKYKKKEITKTYSRKFVKKLGIFKLLLIFWYPALHLFSQLTHRSDTKTIFWPGKHKWSLKGIIVIWLKNCPRFILRRRWFYTLL